MLKKTITFILACLAVGAACAQTATNWYKYPVFNDAVDNIIQTSEKVFYRSGTSLFSYNPTDQESYVYSTMNKLSDVNVAEIYYNDMKKYLLVAYDNGNIDIIFDSGKVINLPDIKDAVVYAPRTINGVAFGPGIIAVATDFGIVIYDDNRFEVRQSAVFNEKVGGIAVCGEYLVIYHDGKLKKAPLSGKVNSLDKFETFYDFPDLISVTGIDDEWVCCIFVNNYIYPVSINGDRRDWAYLTTNLPHATSNGLYCNTDDHLVIIGPGLENRTITLPDNLKKQKMSYYSDPSTVWAGDQFGIASYNISGEQLTDKVIPEGTINVWNASLMRWSPDGRRLYVSNMLPTKTRSSGIADDLQPWPQTTNIIENGEPRNVSLINAGRVEGQPHLTVDWWQDAQGNHRLYGGNYWLVENPFDPEIYFIQSNMEGVFVVKDQHQVANWRTKSQVPYGLDRRTLDINVDPEGNLWVGYFGGHYYSVLPAAKVREGDFLNIKASDWIESPIPNVGVEGHVGKDQTSLFCKKSRMMFFFSGNYAIGIYAYDTKGTYTDTSDDEFVHHSSFTDQSGGVFAPVRTTTMAEDQRGQIWVGTSSGVFVITDPYAAMDPNFRVTRPKVSRNDGTGFADYLLDAEYINWISVDPTNRKWIATESSGIYLVSEDGDEIIAHYDSNNSPLPSNAVYSIEQDPYSNMVYVGTTSGVYRFNGTTAPPAEDYSNIYAYPNPVRPEYSGWITITGLTDNSLVKIADAAGNVIAQMRAMGGQAQWDGCNQSGQRVRSGVYYVFASSSAEETNSSGAVTKIMVIN